MSALLKGLVMLPLRRLSVPVLVVAFLVSGIAEAPVTDELAPATAARTTTVSPVPSLLPAAGVMAAAPAQPTLAPTPTSTPTTTATPSPSPTSTPPTPSPKPKPSTKPVACPKPRPLQVWQVPLHQVMLTFDDGPNPVYTPELLAVLKRYHVKATFFLIGRNAQEYPDVVRQIKAAGMVIGNHSWDHPNLARVSSTKLAMEIDRTSAALKKITGASPCFFRFPYGSANPGAIAAVNVRGMTPFIWTVDTRDWAGVSTSGIISTVWRELSSRHGAVILQHDIQGPRSIDAVPAIIAGLRARGYQFITAGGAKPSP